MDGLEDIPEQVVIQPVNFAIPRSEVGRDLPSREVTSENITDAYIHFILFCNPAYPDDIDTSALRELFRGPPSSNKKTFETWDIFILVKRLNEFDGIRTWQQLALELGVDPGIAEDGAGSQRVPQYIVRLKKWMKGSHIDAFFQYLIGKPHEYYQEIPPLSDPHPAEGRDGIQPSEDLALRALDPRLRPKRGRKRLESNMDDLPPAQRHTFATLPDSQRANFSTPISAVPRSAFPHSAMTDRMPDPWSSISTQFPSALGMSATEPRSAFSAFAADPRMDSMPTPVIANRLNKWNATTGSTSSHSAAGTPMTPSSNLLAPTHSPNMSRNMPSPSQARRAQPQANRPPQSPATSSAAAAATRAASGLGLALDTTYVPPQANMLDQPSSAVSAASTSSRRERQRLQLQVPKHTGPPIRLMTPPAPGQPGQNQEVAHESVESQDQGHVQSLLSGPISQDRVEAAYEKLKRTLAGDLLKSEVYGRETRLVGKDARRLATAALERMGLRLDTRLNIESIVTASVHLGLAHAIDLEGIMGQSIAFPPTSTDKEIRVKRFIVDQDGYEEHADIDYETSGPGEMVKDVYEIFWTINSGGLQGEMRLKGLELVMDGIIGEKHMNTEKPENETATFRQLRNQSSVLMDTVRRQHAGPGDEDAQQERDTVAGAGSATNWREKYFELEKLNKGMHSVLEKAKDKMINVVLEL
ncbi:ARS binding protein 2-domain-containing protein [Elsinoe ampelina]|uniref:ARS binding protein 2-domain-containing protein n=1 Tax=Elsinoe ampelina TaxID=302913 RepID=A0A6A6G7W0_9PEZI|nr:ARS binding protein 2-domain-containing protein [Elsinoe ampelina]